MVRIYAGVGEFPRAGIRVSKRVCDGTIEVFLFHPDEPLSHSELASDDWKQYFPCRPLPNRVVHQENRAIQRSADLSLESGPALNSSNDLGQGTTNDLGQGPNYRGAFIAFGPAVQTVRGVLWGKLGNRLRRWNGRLNIYNGRMVAGRRLEKERFADENIWSTKTADGRARLRYPVAEGARKKPPHAGSLWVVLRSMVFPRAR
ncbi:hypothetical protein C8R46DRAFT_1026848 [Mycena filopes]|nr:hypothetical protein C8R46DRAFT_1026848 [Mycena filopes]